MFEIRKCSEHCPCYRAINNDSCAVLEECTPLPRKFKFIRIVNKIQKGGLAAPPPPHPLKTILYPLPFWDLILNRAACNGPFWKWKVLIE